MRQSAGGRIENRHQLTSWWTGRREGKGGVEKEQKKGEEQGEEENRHDPVTSQKPPSPTAVRRTKLSLHEPSRSISDFLVNGTVISPVPDALLLLNQIKARESNSSPS